jgi:hypothetical protein
VKRGDDACIQFRLNQQEPGDSLTFSEDVRLFDSKGYEHTKNAADGALQHPIPQFASRVRLWLDSCGLGVRCLIPP